MEKNIIPIGKYKGQPVEILSTDTECTNWLLAQSWFKEKHINLHTVIINNFREPSETPEHNKIQIKFLDINYRLKFALLMNKDFFKFDNKGIHSKLESELMLNKYSTELATALRFPDNNIGMKNKKLLSFNNPIFEQVDVSFRTKYGNELIYT